MNTKRNMRRILTLLMATLMLLGSVLPSFAEGSSERFCNGESKFEIYTSEPKFDFGSDFQLKRNGNQVYYTNNRDTDISFSDQYSYGNMTPMKIVGDFNKFIENYNHENVYNPICLFSVNELNHYVLWAGTGHRSDDLKDNYSVLEEIVFADLVVKNNVVICALSIQKKINNNYIKSKYGIDIDYIFNNEISPEEIYSVEKITRGETESILSSMDVSYNFDLVVGTEKNSEMKRVTSLFSENGYFESFNHFVSKHEPKNLAMIIGNAYAEKGSSKSLPEKLKSSTDTYFETRVDGKKVIGNYREDYFAWSDSRDFDCDYGIVGTYYVELCEDVFLKCQFEKYAEELNVDEAKEIVAKLSYDSTLEMDGNHLTYFSKEYKNPTCLEPGNTAEIKCAICNEIVSPSNTVAKLEHKDSNGDGKCDSCGVKIHTDSETNPGDNGGNVTEKPQNFLERLFLAIIAFFKMLFSM